ncbi:MAG: HTH domain-containing protein [Acidobacteriota bacterium]
MITTTFRNAVQSAERQLKQLRHDQVRIERQIQVLESFIESGKALAGAPARPGRRQASVRPRRPAKRAGRRSRKGGPSIADQVEQILKTAKKPLHLKEIMSQLATVRKLRGKAPALSVAGTLNRNTKRFKRVKPNTFAAV